MARLVGALSHNREAAGLIPGQGTRPGGRFRSRPGHSDPWSGRKKRQPVYACLSMLVSRIAVSVSPFFSLKSDETMSLGEDKKKKI